MQACWAEDPNMRPTSRDLERTFEIWIENIANRVCPKLTLSKKISPAPRDNSSRSRSSTPSQPIPPLPADQHELLNKLDERRKCSNDFPAFLTVYQTCVLNS